ncbi:hypothetical protein [Dactylosporangium cerinum]
MREEHDTADVLPDEDELAQRPVYAWQRFQPERWRLPSGRLVLELDDPRYRFGSRTGRWADRTRWRLNDRLDDRLADALAEAEIRAALTQQAEDAAVEAAATRQRDWEQAMADAHEQYTQAHLTRALDRQLQRSVMVIWGRWPVLRWCGRLRKGWPSWLRLWCCTGI